MEACPTPESVLSKLRDPETVILGRGSQGTVYKIGNYVLKTVRFKQDTVQNKERDILTFRNEAEILRRISGNAKLQKFVPKFCWYVVTNESGYFLQRHEPVRTLQNLIANTSPGTFSFEIAHAIYMNLRTAVKRLFEEGYYHRDIKPENILIRTSSEEAMKVPILVDFGLACPHIKMPGLVSCDESIKGGTPTYMVPNILPRQVHQKQKPIKIQGENKYVETKLVDYYVSIWTELYALALTLKEMYPIIDFTGHEPQRTEMLSYIADIEQRVKMNVIKRRRNTMAKEAKDEHGNPKPWGPIKIVEGVGTAQGGTRKKRSQKKRRPSRKS